MVSIIIPVKNGASTLPSCLRAIKRSWFREIELIVIDDHSTDQSREIAASFGAKVLTAEQKSGANNARNLGAEAASGEILIFLDSDIVVTRETILTIVETLEDQPVDAVVGLYTARHRNESMVSQYKNLWVRYSYLKSPPAIDWLFGAVSGIRRDAFQNLGGFDADLLAVHGNDDIEFGKRFSRANLNIVLNPEVEVEHLKRYTLGSFIRNEYNRSHGFAALATRLGETGKSLKNGFVNVYPSFVLSTAFVAIVIALLAAWSMNFVHGWVVGVATGIYFLLNIRFLNYLEQVRGLFAMLAMIPFLMLDHLVCLFGSITGILSGLLRKQ